MATLRPVRVSPSAIYWMFDRCPRCWWRKVHGIQKPKDVLPGIFHSIDRGMKRSVTPEVLRGFGIPATSFVRVDKIAAAPVDYPEHGVRLFLEGRLDRLYRLESELYAIAEFKASEPSARKARSYSAQIHAYEACLRNPALGEAYEVERLDLVFFEPFNQSTFQVKKDGEATYSALKGRLVHWPVEIDRASFDEKLDDIARVSGMAAPPDPGEGCEFCWIVLEAGRMDRERAEVQSGAVEATRFFELEGVLPKERTEFVQEVFGEET